MDAQQQPLIDEALTKLNGAVRDMHGRVDVTETLEAIAHATSEFLPGFEHIGVSLARNGESVETTAATSDLVRELDELQYALWQGPCIDAIDGTPMVTAPDIRHDQRWPDYVPRAVEAGLTAQMAFHLYIDKDGTVGGLNCYSTSTTEISGDAIILGNLFATNAAAALGNVRTVDGLTTALLHRQVIGQAIGYLMAQHNVTEEAAHAYLWRMSSNSNIKVRVLAAEIIQRANTTAQR